MATRPNFHPVLHLPDGAGPVAAGEELPGPDAGGPVPDGAKLHWVYVWIIQNGPEDDPWSAAAYGEWPEETHEEAPAEGAGEAAEASAPFEGTWSVPTEMATPSDAFRPDWPALAMAMALIENPDGTREVYWWNEAVLIRAPAAA